MSKKNNFKVPVNELTASYRTKFPMDHTVKGSFNHGLLIPFDVIECLPGDTFKIDVASILRMSTPIAPIMDNIHMHLAAYFVPNRIIYDNWEQLMGVNKTGAWLTDQNTYYVPSCAITVGAAIQPGSVGDYMGLPKLTLSSGEFMNYNALPGRAYCAIWNEFYRSPVVSAPLPIDHSANGQVLVIPNLLPNWTVNGQTYGSYVYDSTPLPLAKYADYFTKCLPQPIKHDPIPFIADNLPIGFIPSTNITYTANALVYPVKPGSNGDILTAGTQYDFSHLRESASGSVTPSKVFADALNQNWNTIEALRTAFQLDKFYYKDSYARNYRDMLQAHFNVDNKDSVMQLPQKIGELRWRVNIDQVLSTAGYAASSSTTVGAPGANSVTTGKGSLTTFSVTEHGFIIIVGGTRHDHTYAQGFEKQWLRHDRLDYYDPVFARIGDQPVGLGEVYAQLNANGTLDTTVFGYQEAWAEYRFKPDRVCGILNPTVSGSLDFWTLSDNFAAAPQLNETFIYENRNSLQRALVTGSTGPDFIFDMFFKVTAVREMPLFSVPGLVDHF